MVVQKGFKQTEIGIIPEDWGVKNLSEVVNFLDGQRKPIKSNERISGDFPYYGASGIIDYVNDYIFDEELILLGEDGENIISRNLPLAFKVNGKIWVNNHAHVLKPKEGVDITFLTEFLESLDYKLLNSGTAQPKLNKQACYTIKIALPKLHEQTAIANTLSDMDVLIAQTEKLIEKKKAIKQGVMQELLKPKAGWVTKKFTDVVNYIHGKAHEQYIVEDGKFEVVNSKFISTNGVVKKYSDQSFLTAKKGDVLTVLSDLPNGKALAKCYYVDTDNKYAVNQRICIWRSGSCYPKFLYYLLNRHEYFMSLDDGVSQTHILNSHIDKFYLSIPQELETQKEIGDVLWDLDLEIKSLELKLNKIKNQKQGMMQSLLTGKIRLI